MPGLLRLWMTRFHFRVPFIFRPASSKRKGFSNSLTLEGVITATAIAADRAHYLTDIAVNAGVLAALGVARTTGWVRADPVFALAISGYMLWNAWEIARGALVQLLDRELPQDERRRIERTVMACPGVRGIHDMRTRDAGDRVFVEFHLEVDPFLPVEQGHAIADKAEATVAGLFPRRAEVTAHIEPAGIDDERLDQVLRD
jgi:ferrous-iron efflux pump FieF